MKSISGIYKIQSKIKPERIYVGSAVDYKHRWICHLSDLRKDKHGNSRLQNHFNKYGESDLKFSILVGCAKENLIAYEQFYIDSLNPWFNILPHAGSRLGQKTSEETKLKQSLLKIGKPSGRKGIKVSDSERERLRLLNLGKKQSIETINKRISKCIGQKRTDEAKLKMRLAKLGKKNSPEHCISNSLAKNKTAVHKNYILISIKTKTQAEIAKELNIHQSTISKVLKIWKNQNCLV